MIYVTQKERILGLFKQYKKLHRQTLYDLCPDIPTASLRRTLSELKAASVINDIDAEMFELIQEQLPPDPLLNPEKVAYDRKIQNLEDELSETKKRYKDSHRINSFQDLILDAIRELTPQMTFPPPIKLDKPIDTITTESVGLLLSDIHGGEVVLAEQTGGLSEYNIDITAEYIQSLGQKIIHILQTNHSKTKIEKLYVFMLGDMITGMIHNLMEHTPMTAIEAKNYTAMIIACLLRDLNQYYPLVCDCVVGNHPRLTETKRYKWRAEDNLDYDLYIQVATILMNFTTIKFNIPRSFWYIEEVYGWKFLLLHGDDIRSWNQIPWYGIERALKNFQSLLQANNLSFDYACLGHFHNIGTLDRCRGEVILNGSAIGTTDYSIGKLFTGNKPKQLLFGIHKDHGITWRYPINLMRVKNCAYKVDRDVPIHRQIIEAMVAR